MRRPGRVLYIRGVRAPASLKVLVLRGADPDAVDIRGVRAPASLKADDPCAGGGVGRDHIRGVRAPASLKDADRERGEQALEHIRGVRAPASLKVDLRIEHVDHHDNIRGVRAPASLKGDCPERGFNGPSKYPGRSRPGFIEGAGR